MNDWSPFLGLPLWIWLFVLPGAISLASLLLPRVLQPILSPFQRVLDGIYLAGGIIAALFLITILFLIVAQMIARWSGLAFPGSTEFAGYAMAGASFFALAHALTRGSHIRVSLFLNLNGFTKRWLDLAALAVAAVTATYFARFAIKTAGFSHMLNDRTQGQDQMPDWLIALFSLDFGAAGDGWSYTPVWIPQLSMCIGSVLLAICLWDMLIRTAIAGEPVIRSEAVE